MTSVLAAIIDVVSALSVCVYAQVNIMKREKR